VAEEVTTNPEEGPPNADEATTGTDEAPTGTEGTPAVSDEAPAVSEEAPVVTEEAPTVTADAATLTAEAPTTVSEGTPAVTEEAEKPVRRRVTAGSPPRRGSTGRRKEAVARVRLIDGTGKFELNGRTLEEYFPSRAHRMVITEPLRLLGRDKDFDVIARLGGGGISGQAGALRQGIARALIALDPEYRPELKREGLLTRDAREKERRKYGLKKARKAPQYSKR
jgi:small subunit ribosomal protein S9